MCILILADLKSYAAFDPVASLIFPVAITQGIACFKSSSLDVNGRCMPKTKSWRSTYCSFFETHVRFTRFHTRLFIWEISQNYPSIFPSKRMGKSGEETGGEASNDCNLSCNLSRNFVAPLQHKLYVTLRSLMP